MDPRLKQHSLGFYEIAEKPTPEELQKYYAEKYYQEAKGSYEHAYSYEELECFRAKLEQRYFALKKAQPNLKKGGIKLPWGIRFHGPLRGRPRCLTWAGVW
mgnify:CR=1 FL=1